MDRGAAEVVTVMEGDEEEVGIAAAGMAVGTAVVEVALDGRAVEAGTARTGTIPFVAYNGYSHPLFFPPRFRRCLKRRRSRNNG